MRLKTESVLFKLCSQLPVSMEEILDLLNDVNQQLGETQEDMEEEELELRQGPTHSSPARLAETSATISHIKFASPSPSKSIVSPSKRLVSPYHRFMY